jgi:predicted CoA-binding protein
VEPVLDSVDQLLDSRTVAVIGLSPNPHRDSHRVAAYLQCNGYRVIPVNPNVETVLGERAYASLGEVPDGVDAVDVFRRPEYLSQIVDDCITKGVGGVWAQLGVVDEGAAARARAAGIAVVMDLCWMVEHRNRRGGA